MRDSIRRAFSRIVAEPLVEAVADVVERRMNTAPGRPQADSGELEARLAASQEALKATSAALEEIRQRGRALSKQAREVCVERLKIRKLGGTKRATTAELLALADAFDEIEGENGL